MRENRSPGSVQGAPGNQCPYRDDGPCAGWKTVPKMAGYSLRDRWSNHLEPAAFENHYPRLSASFTNVPKWTSAMTGKSRFA